MYSGESYIELLYFAKLFFIHQLGSRLYVVRGKPDEEIPKLVNLWGVELLTFECDTEPYARKRDTSITADLSSKGVNVKSFNSHTLFDMEHYIAGCKGKPFPNSYQAFVKLFLSIGSPRLPVEKISTELIGHNEVTNTADNSKYDVPTLHEMGYDTTDNVSMKYLGGETEALKRLHNYVISRPEWVAQFEKPNTSPNSIDPSTTVLSPYLKFGCISSSLFYHELDKIYKSSKSPSSQPPVSLHGQLLWREFFYFSSFTTPNFDKMVNNPRCKQIPWNHDEAILQAFKLGRTGYPYIDAIMTQLRTEGWIHHLARHSVACFLTRGDLWQSWEKGNLLYYDSN